MAEVYSSRVELKGTPTENADWDLFVSGSSFVRNGTQRAGYVVVTIRERREGKALSSDTWVQEAELTALLRSLALLSTDKAFLMNGHI